MSFVDEIKNYTDDELELILTTQKELYSDEEWDQLQALKAERTRVKREKYEEWVATRLPETIVCEKCDGPNPFANNVCEFCGSKLDKAKYYTDEYYSLLEEEKEGSEELPVPQTQGPSYTFHYVISFLIPFVGFIVGAVMLANDDAEKRSCGKACIITAIVSMIVNAVLVGILWVI